MTPRSPTRRGEAKHHLGFEYYPAWSNDPHKSEVWALAGDDREFETEAETLDEIERLVAIDRRAASLTFDITYNLLDRLERIIKTLEGDLAILRRFSVPPLRLRYVLKCLELAKAETLPFIKEIEDRQNEIGKNRGDDRDEDGVADY